MNRYKFVLKTKKEETCPWCDVEIKDCKCFKRKPLNIPDLDKYQIPENLRIKFPHTEEGNDKGKKED
jgi:hypothetical protein